MTRFPLARLAALSVVLVPLALAACAGDNARVAGLAGSPIPGTATAAADNTGADSQHGDLNCARTIHCARQFVSGRAL